MIAGPGGADLPRFTTLAALAVVMTFLLVVVGAIVRATDSGLGCPEWPTCHGSWIPPLDDPHAIIEWSHRTTAALTGLVVAALAIAAVVSQRSRRTVVVASVGAAGLVVFQAWLGKMAVESELSGDIVVAHLATAMGLFALVLFVWVRSRYPVLVPQAGGWTGFTVLAALTALATYGLMLLGAHVTATGTALVFDDWPPMDGGLWPTLDPGVLPHVLHRWASVAVGFLVAGTVWLGVRGEASAHSPAGHPGRGPVPGPGRDRRRPGPDRSRPVDAGRPRGRRGGHVRRARDPGPHRASRGPDGLCIGHGARARSSAGETSTRGDTVRAYVALTKPRIIELLLVTTVPTMVLAQGGIPPLALIGAVLIGGTLAAGGANAINQYLDRDIDDLMRRTRNRPLPRHAVSPPPRSCSASPSASCRSRG